MPFPENNLTLKTRNLKLNINLKVFYEKIHYLSISLAVDFVVLVFMFYAQGGKAGESGNCGGFKA